MPDPVGAPTVAELVEQHYELVYRYAYRLSGSVPDAEDLTQQTFLHAQMHLSQLREPGKARAWLCTILRNCYRREVRQHRTVSLESLESIPMEAATNGETDNPEIDQEALQQALNDLPEEFRTPVILFYFEEFSYRQIAEQMLIPLGTVMSRLARGKAHLRARLFQRALAGSSSSRRPHDEL